MLFFYTEGKFSLTSPTLFFRRKSRDSLFILWIVAMHCNFHTSTFNGVCRSEIRSWNSHWTIRGPSQKLSQEFWRDGFFNWDNIKFPNFRHLLTFTCSFYFWRLQSANVRFSLASKSVKRVLCFEYMLFQPSSNNYIHSHVVCHWSEAWGLGWKWVVHTYICTCNCVEKVSRWYYISLNKW